jgi:hypothetical protein
LRESSTVGWDSVNAEFQFIANDPGPVLLVSREMLAEAFQQKDGSWLLRGYTDPDRTHWCEFIVRTPLLNLARSLLPPVATAAPSPASAVEDASRAQPALVGWQPAPPLPPDSSTPPVSFYKPRQEPVEQHPEPVLEVAEEIRNDHPVPPVSVVAEDFATEEWVVSYVWNDPTVADNEPRSLRVRAASDAGALRALHAEMQKLAEEPSYRVTAVIPAEHAEVAA